MQKKISQRDLEEGVVSSNEIMSSMSLPPPVDQTKKRGRVEFEKTLGKVSCTNCVIIIREIRLALVQ